MSNSFNIQEILTCLKNTYLSSDKKIRNESEKILSELKELNIVTFTSKLIDLLKISSNELDKNLKMSIILLLQRSIKEKIIEGKINNNSNNQLIQLYITIIVNPIINEKELDNLKETFIILLNNTKSEVLIEMIEYISKQLLSMPLSSVNGVIHVLISIIVCLCIKGEKEFLVILEGVLNISFSILENLYCKYEKLDVKINSEDYLKFYKIFMNIFHLFFQCILRTYKQYKIKNENISNIYDKILIIGIKLLVNLKSQDNNRIISWTGNKDIDDNVNMMKINIFKFLNYQITINDDMIMDKNKEENHNLFIKIIVSNLEWLIMNKFTYLIKIELEDECPDYNYTLIISFMFIYLKRIFIIGNFYYEYTTHFNSIFKNILLPLLLITNVEENIALDNDSFNEYIIDINDIIYKNKQKKIKSTLAGLIKNIFMKNRSSNNFMVNYSVGLLDHLINNNSNFEDKTLFEENDIIILLLKVYSKEKIITTLFLALNIFSQVEKCIGKVENDNLINQIYTKSFEKLANNYNYPPLKHQLIIFIKNYSLRFFEPDEIPFETNIKLLFSFFFENKHLLIPNSAADVIQYFFSDYNDTDNKSLISTLLKVATNLNLDFEKHIIEVENSNFFEVLYQIITNSEIGTNKFYQSIFENLCKRIYIEVERHFRLKFIVKKEKSQKKKISKEQIVLNNYKIIINKCFNIIRFFINNKRFVGRNLELIETSLKPLMTYMEDPKKINFDEDIIYIIYMLIIQLEKVTGISFRLIQHLYKYIDKVKGVLLDSYQLINAYLAYGTEQILVNKVWYEGLFSAFKSGIESFYFQKSSLYTCMLLQTWVIHCVKIPNNNLADIINLIINKIQTIIEKNQTSDSLEDKKYSFLGYVTLILSGLINYSSIIINALKKTNNLDNLINWLQIIVKENEIIFEYEIKIIIYSVCMIIKNGIIIDNIELLLNICFDLLKYQEKNGKYELKKKTKKMLNFAFVEEEEDEDDSDKDDEEEEDEEYNEYKEMKEIVKKTINPIKDMDEFKNFNDLLNFLKNNRSDIYNSWINSLDDVRKNNLKKIFEVKRILIQYNKNNSMVVPRRIVYIKRNINNMNNQ